MLFRISNGRSKASLLKTQLLVDNSKSCCFSRYRENFCFLGTWDRFRSHCTRQPLEL